MLGGDTIRCAAPRFYGVCWDGGHQWGLTAKAPADGTQQVFRRWPREFSGCLLSILRHMLAPNKPLTPSEASHKNLNTNGHRTRYFGIVRLVRRIGDNGT